MRHVIIGNGPAGIAAAEAIRKRAPHDDIVVLGDEPGPPYSRMAIPYLLAGRIGEEGTLLRKDPGHFARLDIALKPGRALAVDVAARAVRLADGTRLPFDRLLLATGAAPVRPTIPGIDLAAVQTCWSLADARRIVAGTPPGARVLQIGAGFIGCIILEALVARGVRLTVVEMADRMVPRMMGEGASAMIRRWVEQKGVAVHTGTEVRAIEGGPPYVAHLAQGAAIPVDLVICAAGVRPNTAMLEGSGIPCDRGILTDAAMQTGVAGVYAAGDCAEAFDARLGRHVLSAIQPTAVDEGACAGTNMAGGHAVLAGIPSLNVLDTLGLVSSSFGQWQGVPGGDYAEVTDPTGFRHLRLEFDGDVLVGSNAIGHTEHLGVLRGLTQSRAPLGAWKDVLRRDPLRFPEAYLASAQRQQARGHA